MTADAVDILVVGAGPAGSAAALAASRSGARVVMVERRQKVGMPVQCAEYIPAMLKGELGLGSDYVVQNVAGMRTFVSGEAVKQTAAPGCVIRRDRFDAILADAAVAAGTDLRCATRAARLDPNGTVTLIPKTGIAYRLRPRVIVGADGPFSNVGRWAGAINRQLLPAVQMTLPLTAPLSHTEIYFFPEITAGYGWLFPKGRVANVGLGTLRPGPGSPRVRELLDRFVDRLMAADKISGRAVGYAAGWIPVAPLSKAVYGNMILVGDAAGHTHPITGAGIFSAVSGGRMAGKWAARAVMADDITMLGEYEAAWRDLLGPSLARARQRREQMEAEWRDFSATVHRCWVAFREYYA